MRTDTLPVHVLAGADIAKYVTPISDQKGGCGGKYVEDVFSIINTSVTAGLCSRFNNNADNSFEALVFRANRTAVMLCPPLEFRFKTVRTATNENVRHTELVVTGHFICLVDRIGPKGPRWAFDEYTDDKPWGRGNYGSAANKLGYKVALARAVRKLGDKVVPRRILTFLSIL